MFEDKNWAYFKALYTKFKPDLIRELNKYYLSLLLDLRFR
jgi:hypothetical protein